MPNICQSNLISALQVNWVQLFFSSVYGLFGVIGWGVIYEKLLSRQSGSIFGRSNLYSQGLIIVSILMLLGSLTGFCNLVRPIAFSGSIFSMLFLGLHFWKNPLRFKLNRTHLLLAILWVMALLGAFALMAEPLPFGDATAIWGYHAKALTCECLFRAHYTHEKIWTGTHPEYPVLVPFLYSYFFSITDSFRDDWAKIWQAILLIEVSLYSFQVLSKKTQSPWIGLIGSVILLALFKTQASDGRVEFASISFSALIALLFLEEKYTHLPLFIFALAFTKNEGLASSIIFLSLLAVSLLLKKREKPSIRFFILNGVVIGFIALLLSRLPSNHEQYPSHLLSWNAWKQGFANLPVIFSGAGKRLLYWPWALIFVFGSLSFIRFGLPYWLKRKSQPVFFKPTFVGDYIVLITWPLIMLVIFFCIYIVTPWGPDLYKVTFDRLLSQIFSPLLLGVLGIFGLFQEKLKQTRLKFLIRCILMIFFLGYAVPLGKQTRLFLIGYFERFDKEELGLNAYLKHGFWKRALQLDALLPTASRGAILNEHAYFDINYMLYPRLIYPQDPNQVAGTSKPWQEWKNKDEVDLRAYGFQFLLDGDQIIRLETR